MVRRYLVRCVTGLLLPFARMPYACARDSPPHRARTVLTRFLLPHTSRFGSLLDRSRLLPPYPTALLPPSRALRFLYPTFYLYHTTHPAPRNTFTTYTPQPGFTPFTGFPCRFLPPSPHTHPACMDSHFARWLGHPTLPPAPLPPSLVPCPLPFPTTDGWTGLVDLPHPYLGTFTPTIWAAFPGLPPPYLPPLCVGPHPTLPHPTFVADIGLLCVVSPC